MRAKGVALVVGLFLVLGAAAPSCVLNQPFIGGTPTSPTIQFEGDSITVYAADAINSHYGTSNQVAIHAIVGATTYENAGNVAADAEQHPDVTVINFGTNDAARVVTGLTTTYDGNTVVLDPVEPISNVIDRLDAMETEFSPACVVFVTVNSHDASWYGTYAMEAMTNIAAINNHIRSTYAHVADWDAAWESGYFASPANPHPNDIGNQALLALEDQAIAGCPS